MRNLEVYFSKLPKSCLECPCFQNDEMCCGLDDGTQDFFKDEIDGGKCPLKKIHSHNSLCEKIDNLRKENFHLKKQLHKEKQEIVNDVCEKIKKLWKEQAFYYHICDSGEKLENKTYKCTIIGMNEILFGNMIDQIQKEYEK